MLHISQNFIYRAFGKSIGFKLIMDDMIHGFITLFFCGKIHEKYLISIFVSLISCESTKT